MARLTDLAAEIAGLLQGITVANGYSFNMGTVNQPDLALVSYPAADISYSDDRPETSTMAAYGFDVCNFAIKITPFNPNSNAVSNPGAGQPTPVHAIDQFIDQVIAAIKYRVRFQQGNLPLSGNAYMIYKGFKKTIEKAGDIFKPTSVVFNLEVHYQSTELEDFTGAAPLQTITGNTQIGPGLIETVGPSTLP
jgi:hypothetical protein